MKEIQVQEFVRRVHRDITENQPSRFTFFLGAGCSRSSGIPTAGELVRNRWLPKLKEIEEGGSDSQSLGEWAKTRFPGYAGDNAAEFYGPVIEALFPQDAQRQPEIARLTEGKDPGFGYAVLAQLISHEDYGVNCNTILTTNFDDMVADALYLYTNKKPLVIAHESLIGFVRNNRERPLVLKLHGDARLEPKNTEVEVESLDEAVRNAFNNLLSESGLIFLGYGGNDKGILDALKGLPKTALPWGVYWVNNNLPNQEMHDWLEERKTTWVKHRDFDEAMVLHWEEYDLEHPSSRRFERLLNKYFETFNKLRDKVHGRPDSEEKDALEGAIEKAESEFTDWWAVELEARKYSETEPDKADAIYREGIKKFKDSHKLMGSYAVFLKNIRKDYDQAAEFYLRAIEADPEDANILGNYAIFLTDIRKEHDTAEEFYKRALEADPEDANHLGNYGIFLTDIRKDNDKAEEFYQRAIEADPDDANTLGNYAVFLKKIRKDYDKAEQFYLRAIEADPEHANILGNYALFLETIRKDYDQAEAFYQRAIEIDPTGANKLGNYAGFLLAQGKQEKGFELLDKAIKLADPEESADLLLECRFYQYAHTNTKKERKASLVKIKKLIEEGVRSKGSVLEDTVKRAVESGHPEGEMLAVLAEVIAEEEEAEALEKFEAWREA